MLWRLGTIVVGSSSQVVEKGTSTTFKGPHPVALDQPSQEIKKHGSRGGGLSGSWALLKLHES